MQQALAEPVKHLLDVTSSPVPCMISKGMAKILLYICTDLLLPLLILTSRTLKFVPPRSRARNFPFSVRDEGSFILVLLVACLPVRTAYYAHPQETSSGPMTAHCSLWHLSHQSARMGLKDQPENTTQSASFQTEITLALARIIGIFPLENTQATSLHHLQVTRKWLHLFHLVSHRHMWATSSLWHWLVSLASAHIPAQSSFCS